MCVNLALTHILAGGVLLCPDLSFHSQGMRVNYEKTKIFNLAMFPKWDYHISMRIIALSTLKAFWEENPEYEDAQAPILAWHRFVMKADWATPAEVKADFRNASILKDGRVIFNIAGNKYRLVVWINYPYRVVYIRFIGTHETYDGVDPQTIWGGSMQIHPIHT